MSISIRELAKRFYEIVNGEGELGEVLSDDFQFGNYQGIDKLIQENCK